MDKDLTEIGSWSPKKIDAYWVSNALVDANSNFQPSDGLNKDLNAASSKKIYYLYSFVCNKLQNKQIEEGSRYNIQKTLFDQIKMISELELRSH